MADTPLKPRGWMRRWFIDGEKPYRKRNEEGRMVTPMKFHMLPATPNKIYESDEPLFSLQDLRAAGIVVPYDADAPATPETT